VSFNASDKSGEAVAFDPTILIPFGGIGKGVSLVGKTAFEGLKQIFPTTIKEVGKQGAPITITTSNKISQVLKNLLTPKTQKIIATGGAGASVTTAATIIPKGISTGTKTLIGTGLVTVPLTAGIATFNTPQGQEAFKDLTNLADKGLDATKDFSEFIKANGQLLTIFLIIAGGALLVGALKK
jgi:hypothetical protein